MSFQRLTWQIDFNKTPTATTSPPPSHTHTPHRTTVSLTSSNIISKQSKHKLFTTASPTQRRFVQQVREKQEKNESKIRRWQLKNGYAINVLHPGTSRKFPIKQETHLSLTQANVNTKFIEILYIQTWHRIGAQQFTPDKNLNSCLTALTQTHTFIFNLMQMPS